MLLEKDVAAFLEEKYRNQKIKFIGGIWSSFAFLVGDQVFRFPKEDVEEYKTEAQLLKFIRGRISFPIPDLSVFTDQKYPYSVHKYLEGSIWSVKEIEKGEFAELARDAARFLHELHSIPMDEISAAVPTVKAKFKRHQHNKDVIYGYLKDHVPFDDFNKIYEKYQSACQQTPGDFVFCHGDFTGTNSLISEDRRLAGVIDWTTSGWAEREYEFWRFLTDDNIMAKAVIAEYEKLSGAKINFDRVMQILLMDHISVVFHLNTAERLFPFRESLMKDYIIPHLKWFI
ncbi:MAG: aminoglycoside phosphotransferase family protein [Alphaproteobacteria bacterium]|nr:aminoglycoside phosphotransferase family protein [Alphaproteobacteria bacterium]